MSPLTRICGTCRTRKYLSDFYPDRTKHLGRANVCKVCRKRAAKEINAIRHLCRGCGKPVFRFQRCESCRAAHQAAQEAAFNACHPSPDECGIGECREILADSTNFLGEHTVICRVHGERLVVMRRPPGFVRYDQDERRRAELDAKLETATRKSGGHHGDNGKSGWRQTTHRAGSKGAAEHLKTEVA